MARCGFGEPGVSTVEHCRPPQPTPTSAQDWFAYWPASRSACVTVWLAVQLIVPPGARLATGVAGVHVRPVAFGSVTSTLCSVTLPSLVTLSLHDALPISAL